MLVHDEIMPQPGAPGALHIVEEAKRLLYEHLVGLRLRGEVRQVCLRHLHEPGPIEPNAYALHIPLKKDRRAWARDMRPTSLWLIALYEDRLLVLAGGCGMWEYQRREQARAFDRMEKVLREV